MERAASRSRLASRLSIPCAVTRVDIVAADLHRRQGQGKIRLQGVGVEPFGEGGLQAIAEGFEDLHQE